MFIRKISILVKYLNIIAVFLIEWIIKLPKYLYIKKNITNLAIGKQILYIPIYRPKIIELEIFKN